MCILFRLMVAIPFLVYLALIGLGWFVIGRILPGLLVFLRKVGSRVATGITRRGATERLTSFLPRSVHRLRPYAALIVIVATGLGAAYVAGHLFLDLAEGLRAESETMLAIDQSVHSWTQSNRYEALTPFYLTFSVLGNPVGLTLLLLIGFSIAIARRQWGLAVYLAATGSLGGLLNLYLKRVFGRERPDLFVALSDAAHESFPSGHTMGSAIVLGALAYASLRLTSSWRLKSMWASASLVTMLTIALSRIYLGVHWSSDIAAGFAAGFACLLTSIVVYETIRNLQRRRASPGENYAALDGSFDQA